MTDSFTITPAKRLEGLGITLIRQIMGRAPANAINLGIGQVDGDVPSVIADALIQARTARSAPYGPTPGFPPLVARIAEKYGVDLAQVIVTIGVEESIAVACLAMLNPGDHLLIPDPAFPVYETLGRIAGATVNHYTLRAEDMFRPTWEQIERALTPQTRLVFLCSPGNPTGAVAEPEEWRRIGEGLRARGIPYLSDEIYLDLQIEEPNHPCMREISDRGFVTAGLSKTHALAGWRIGWLISPPEVAAQVTALHQYLVTSGPSPIHEAAVVAFEPQGQAACRAIAEDLVERRALARELFTALGFEIRGGDGAFYLFARHPRFSDDLELINMLMDKAGVILIPGRAFGPGGIGFVRISYAAAPDKLREAARRIGAALEAV